MGTDSKDFKGYIPYEWFIKKVGGETSLVPREHGMPLILRLHYIEFAVAAGAKPNLERNAEKFLKGVDEFYDYHDGGLAGMLGRLGLRYPKGYKSNKGANLAYEFFVKAAIGPDMREYINTFSILGNNMYKNIINDPNKMKDAVKRYGIKVNGRGEEAIKRQLIQQLGLAFAYKMLVEETREKFR